MKNIDLYTIGNALVDYDFEVDDATLARLNVEKGVMTLVDEQRQTELMTALSGYKHIRACGGSAANSTITLQQLGGQSYYCCKLANDDTGKFFYQELIDAGMHTNMTADKRGAGISGKCITKATPDAERTMSTFLGVSAELGIDDVDFTAINRSHYLYIEGYLASSDIALQASLTAIEEAKKHDVQIAFGLADLNMVRYARAGLSQVLACGIDVLFANEVEALAYTETDDIKAAANQLAKHAKLIIITRSAKGALGYFDGNIIEQAAYPVKAVDTVGAGDIFAGTILYALTQNIGLDKALDIACFASAQVIGKFGARLTDQQVELVKQHLATVQ